MAPLPGAGFRDRFADLPPGDRAALVAAVHDARGWDVERDGPEVRVTPPNDDRPRQFAVRVDGEAVATRADGPPLEVEDLREMFAYAIDADDRGRLCRRFFDCDPGDFEATREGTDATESLSPRPERTADASPSGETGGRPTDRDGADGHAADADESTAERTPRTRRAFVAGAAAVALGGAAVAAGTLPVPTPGVGGGDAPSRTPASGAADGDGSFPPGVDGGGIADVSLLADAHVESLLGRPHRMRITHREYVDDRLRGVAHERVAVAATDRYRSQVRRFGTLEYAGRVVSTGSTYANGDTLYIRQDEGAEQFRRRALGVATAPNRFVDRTKQYVRRYLAVDSSRVVGSAVRDGTNQVWLGLFSWFSTRSMHRVGRARVAETGVVRALHRSFLPGDDARTRVAVTVRVDPAEVTVTRPAWVEEGNTATPSTPTARPPRSHGGST